MPRAALVRRIAAGVLLIATVKSPGQETRRARPNDAPDYKVVIWFSRSDPIGTFQYQVYDVRKGEYTNAVDAWLGRIRSSYPTYVAFTRDVVLKNEKGATEKLKVGAVIQRDLLAVAELSGVGLAISLGAPAPSKPRGPSRGPIIINPEIGSARMQPSAPYPFPVPFPYPRPHP